MATRASQPDKNASYEGLARRYRPQNFGEVIGQAHVVGTLRRAVETGLRATAYLFVGGRGLGKTTMARILAKALNCEKGTSKEPCGACTSCLEIASGSHIDVLEIDAASHTGVDNVRETIIQAVATAPARGRVKVFIIDEAHMLSNQAFGALLKTMEEPPPHVLFILATTEGHKVPSPIRSRCQRFDFRPVSLDELAARLGDVAKKEGIAIDEDAVRLIGDYAEGGVRDALSALDLVRSFCPERITLKGAEEALGVIPTATLRRFLDLVGRGDSAACEELLREVLRQGADAGEILKGLLSIFRQELIAQVGGRDSAFSRGRLVRSVEAILAAADRARFSRHPQVELEVLLCRLAEMANEEMTLKQLYDRLIEIETDSGAAARSSGGPAPERTETARPVRPSDEMKTGREGARRPSPSGAASFPMKRFHEELAGAAPVASALCKDVRVESKESGSYLLLFDQPFLFERFGKDRKAQGDVKKVLESIVGGKVSIDFRLVEGSAPAPVQNVFPLDDGAEPAKSSQGGLSGGAQDLEPEIERIRRIFKADVVEIVDE